MVLVDFFAFGLCMRRIWSIRQSCVPPVVLSHLADARGGWAWSPLAPHRNESNLFSKNIIILSFEKKSIADDSSSLPAPRHQSVGTGL
jgi:hypothetical protein